MCKPCVRALCASPVCARTHTHTQPCVRAHTHTHTTLCASLVYEHCALSCVCVRIVSSTHCAKAFPHTAQKACQCVQHAAAQHIVQKAFPRDCACTHSGCTHTRARAGVPSSHPLTHAHTQVNTHTVGKEDRCCKGRPTTRAHKHKHTHIHAHSGSGRQLIAVETDRDRIRAQTMSDWDRAGAGHLTTASQPLSVTSHGFSLFLSPSHLRSLSPPPPTLSLFVK